MVKILRVTAPHFVAGAVWKKEDGTWCCVLAAPILRWMVGMCSEAAKQYLEKKSKERGWTTEWI